MQDDNTHGKKRSWLRRAAWLIALGVILVAVVLLFWLRGALYNRFVGFPREEAAWQALRAQLQPVPNQSGWNEYRGILHSHSQLSHDSEVPFEEILGVLKTAKLDFICLSDHPTQGRADFGLQWRGHPRRQTLHPGLRDEGGDDALWRRLGHGAEQSDRFSDTGQADRGERRRAVLRPSRRSRGIGTARNWWAWRSTTSTPTSSAAAPGSAACCRICSSTSADIRSMSCAPVFIRPVEFLRRWDELNRTRHITGIAANDCHQNVGVRAFYTDADTIRVEDTSPKTLKEFKLNWFTRPLARLFFGPLTPNRKLFHVQLDPYERSARFVNTHVLAHELAEPAILDALRAGRVFVGFDMIADSSGFQWFAADGTNQVVMGEAAAFTPATRLGARSPLPCRFTILKNGSVVCQQEGRALDWTPSGPGKYRVEAELKVLGEWVPWVYANPIELR